MEASAIVCSSTRRLKLDELPAAAASLQLRPTLCDPIDCSPPGSPVPGILQARTLEWVAISLSNAWKWKVKVKSLSRVWLFTTPWTATYQAPPSVGFSRQEYWSGVPLPSPNELPNYLKSESWETHIYTYRTSCLTHSPCFRNSRQEMFVGPKERKLDYEARWVPSCSSA